MCDLFLIFAPGSMPFLPLYFDLLILILVLQLSNHPQSGVSVGVCVSVKNHIRTVLSACFAPKSPERGLQMNPLYALDSLRTMLYALCSMHFLSDS